MGNNPITLLADVTEARYAPGFFFGRLSAMVFTGQNGV
jgi:hypothetical protein